MTWNTSCWGEKEPEEKRGKQLKAHEERLQELSDSLRKNNIHFIGIPEDVERGPESMFEQMMTENFPNLEKETSIHIQEVEKTPQNRQNPINTPTYNSEAYKFQRYRENPKKQLKTRELLIYMGRNIRLTADLSTETWQARKSWHDISRLLNEKNMQPRIFIQQAVIQNRRRNDELLG